MDERDSEVSEQSSGTEDELFEVERIIGRRKRFNKWEYLIKWKGYGEGINSWEPENNLVGCTTALSKFKDDDDDDVKKEKTPKKRQSRKTIHSVTPTNSPKSVTQLEEMDVDSKYKILHHTLSPPVSPISKEVRDIEFSEYKEAKPENEEKFPKDKDLTKDITKGKSSFKIIATIVLFLLLVLALVQPVGFRKPITHT